MPTYTTTYSLGKPVVGADEDAWGDTLNASLDSIDDILDGTTPVTGIDINSGTLDGVTIGGTTAGAGTFTTLTANTSITGTLATAAQPNITSVGTLTGLTVSASASLAGASTSADITFGDNDKAIFGAGSDLQIYHDGSNSYISEVGVGQLFVDATSLRLRDASSNLYLLANSGAEVELFYNGDKKFETTNIGADVIGSLDVVKGSVGTVASFSGDDVSGLRGLKVITSTTTNTGDTHSINAQSSTGILKLSTNNDTQRLVLSPNGDISFYEDTGTTAKFFWDASAESLGIGTTPSGSKLHLRSDTSSTYVRFQNSSASDIYVGANEANLVAFNGGSERMRIDSSGNVGIGTSSPAYNFQLSNTTGDANLGITASTTGLSQVLFTDGAVAGKIAYRHATNAMEFATNGTEAMRIDSSGNLLVGGTGTAPDTSSTDTGHAFRADGRAGISRDGGPALSINRLTSDGNIAEFRKDGSTVGSIGNAGSNLVIGDGQEVGLRFSAYYDAIYPVNGSSYADANGLIDLGRSGSKFRNAYLSGGVYLGGTGAANKLDDYEEGTWTPTTSGDATGTLTVAQGFYRKIGNMVFAFYQFDVGVTFTSNAIGGLPFTVGNIFTSSSIIGATGAVYTTGTATSCANESSTILSLFEPTGGTNSAHEPLASGGVYRGNVVYMTS